MQWMMPSEQVKPPYIAVFRSSFASPENAVLKFRYSADERARLFLDGKYIGEGPERGTPLHWHYAEIEHSVSAGRHVLTAQVLAFGGQRTAQAQTSICHGFHFEEQSRLITAPWEYQVLEECSYSPPSPELFSFPHIHVREGCNWDILSGRGGEWKPVLMREDERILHAPVLPAMRFEEVKNYIRKGNVFLFDDYMCLYPEYEFSGRGSVRLRWAEPGCDPDRLTDEFMKGHKPGEKAPYFSGEGERFQLPGHRVEWKDYWWHAGRTLEMTLEGDAKLEAVRFFRTGYPHRLKVPLEVPGDERMTRLLKRSFRTLEACSFETFMDCPYYEQLQYIGDSRIDALSLYEVSDDVRLIEKALRQFADGQYPNGALPCRYPAKDPVYDAQFGEFGSQQIPSFILFYIQMVYDFALRRKNDVLVRELMPVLRKAEAYIRSCLNGEGLLAVPGWNFIDWLPNWESGVPPHGERGGGCTLDWLYVLSLKNLAELEREFGDSSAAPELTAVAEHLEQTIPEVYYEKEKGLFAETPEHDYYSEHAQVFALLAGNRTEAIPALKKGGIDECGIYFSFYYLEACRRYGLTELFEARKEKFLKTADAPQLRTMPELFLNDWWLRSDCHAWSSHFLYHYFKQRNQRSVQ